MEAIFKRWLSKVEDKFRQNAFDVSARIKYVMGIISLEDESNESRKAFYLISVMLLVSLVFLSPDKIPQTLLPMQSEIGMLDKIQEVTRVLRKFMPSLG